MPSAFISAVSSFTYTPDKRPSSFNPAEHVTARKKINRKSLFLSKMKIL